MIYQNLKHKESYVFWWLPNHQTDQNYCRYDMNILCLLQAVYECQTPKPKGGKPWKFHKLQKSGLITTLPTRKKNTVRAYKWVINKLCNDFGGDELTELSSEKILQFLNTITDGCKPRTKRVRFSHLSFFLDHLQRSWSKSSSTLLFAKKLLIN